MSRPTPPRFAAFGEITVGLCLAVGVLTTFAGLGFIGLLAAFYRPSEED